MQQRCIESMLPLLVLLSCGTAYSQPQLVTVAGGPPAPGTSPLAISVDALAVATDAQGNIYFTGPNRIYKLTTSGQMSTYAGTGVYGFGGDEGPATEALLADPRGLGTDADGNLYISDTGNNRIRRVDRVTGVITTIAGTGQASFTGNGGFPATQSAINSPWEIAVDGPGNVYVAAYNNNRILRINRATGLLDVISQMAIPKQIVLDRQGGLYAASSTSDALVHIVNGVPQPAVGGGTRQLADGVNALEARNPYVVWMVVDPEGLLVFNELTTGIWRVRNGLLEHIQPAQSLSSSAALEPAGNLILGFWRSEVRRVFPNGNSQRIAGNGLAGDCGDGGLAVNACFFGGRIVYADDRLYFAGVAGLRQITADGRVSRVSRDPAANIEPFGASRSYVYGTSGFFALPSTGIVRVSRTTGRAEPVAGISSGGGIGDASLYAVDPLDNVYVPASGEILSCRGGQCARIAGTGMPGDSGDGGPATSAMVMFPSGLTWANGYLYFVDLGRLRRINLATGIIEAVAANVFSSRLAVDRANNVYVVDNGVTRIDSRTGMRETVVDGSMFYPNAHLSAFGVGGIAVSPQGTLFASDGFSQQLRAVGSVLPGIPCIADVSPSAFSFAGIGDSGRISIQTTGCEWTVEDLPAWLSVSPAGGTGSSRITLTAQPNPGTATRTATLKIGTKEVTVSQGGVGCFFGVPMASIQVPANGSTVNIQVNTTAGCTWSIATSTPWIHVLSPTMVEIDGLYSSTAHSGSIIIAGQSIPVLQLGILPTTLYGDVPSTHPFAPYIALLGFHVTLGCPASSFCPGAPLTRAAGAVFIARELFGSDSYPFRASPYYGDVLSGHPAFAAVQALRDAGVVDACSTGGFCPDDPLDRATLAVWLVRAYFFEPGRPESFFPFPAFPYFGDVSQGNPAFRYIQKLRQLGITTGCTPTEYCPALTATRGELAAMLVRAFQR